MEKHAMILFFIIAINEIHSLPPNSNLAHHSDIKRVDNDFYSNIEVSGRVRRNRPLTDEERLAMIYKNETIANIWLRTRSHDTTERAIQVLLQNFRAIVNGYQHNGRRLTTTEAIHRFAVNHEDMADRLLNNENHGN